MLKGPPLDKICLDLKGVDRSGYPFSLPILENTEEIFFPSQVTFFVGENGTGKSTILEAIAVIAGFGPEGGSRNIHFSSSEERFHDDARKLAARMRPSWRKKPADGNGYFFRAESFFSLANHIDTIAREGGQGPGAAYAPYGGKSLHEQSHGESFLSFFINRIRSGGFFVFDEPEAALSPQRQLSLLTIIHDLCEDPDSQFVIATHSPILLAYPGATIYSCDSGSLRQVGYKETSHYEITREFLDNPERYFAQLFKK
ncbi:MAG: AAA family ATPase [bacterium]